MRYFLLFTIVFLSLIACTEKNADIMNVSGTVKDLKKGTLLFQKFEDTLLVTIDSLVIDGNANFTFSDYVESPEMYYLYLRLKDGSLLDDRIIFFGENSEIQINTHLKNFGSAAMVSGSKNDSVYRSFLKLKERYISRNLDLIEERFTLDSRANDSLKSSIENRQRALHSSQYFATINFALNHSEFELAPYIMLTEVSEAHIKYLDTVYQALTPKIKDSKYGKAMESFINNRKETDSL